ncbi:tetratricopeptide repeat protein [Agrobacterium sp. a22-2]|uniref:tetratricopeptide repeat protein n=1 Tax=Agrobacterium sp. a22-2 TaxID=2283840 RepID=UPI001448858A|nr:tetratricopeptide repeat protein [Agrobacterium sp. a22-2]NKN36411.1 tetratricopeptide repeat protein [Agrobacterium sp. a22-2]
MILIEDRLQAAEAHRLEGRSENALLLYQSVLDINPANIEAIKGVAEIQLAQGNVAEALALAAKAVALSNCDLAALALLAQAAQLTGDAVREAAALDQAALLDPFEPVTIKLRAGLAARNGDLVTAEKILVDALAVHPQEIGLIAALSQVYMEAGLVGEALELSQKALALKPQQPDTLMLAGTQLAALGEHSQALGLFEQAFLLEPGNVLLMACLADCHAGLGQLSEAHRIAQRVIGLRPDFLPGWRVFSRVMILRGEAAIGLRDLATACRQHPDRIEALIALADGYRAAGEHRQALALLDPLANRLAGLPAQQRQSVIALLRDCRLSLGLIEEAGALTADVRLGQPDSTFGLPNNEQEAVAAIGSGAVAQAFAALPVIIGPAVPILEALPLLRFCTGGGDRRRQITGPAGFADLVDLVPGTVFAIAEDDDPQTQTAGIPLAAVLALPADVRGGIELPEPYIEAPQERRAIWQGTFADLPRPLVAIAWNGSRPGLLLDDLRPALDGFSGTLVSVAWDDSRHQLAFMPDILDAGVHFGGLSDLAGVLAEIDAIIGPDGVALHMAGAMGRPGAVLVQPNAAWYWHAKDEFALWYPSIRVLRTGKVGHWSAVLDDVRQGLVDFLAALPASGAAVPKAEDGALRQPTDPQTRCEVA